MADIFISKDDLKDPSIDDMINLQRSAQPQQGEKIADVKTPFYYNPIFYYCLACVLGAMAVWGVTEPFYNDTEEDFANNIPFLSDYLLFGPVAGVLSLSLGLVYGFVNRNWKQSAYCGAVGLGVGLGATLVTTIIANIIFNIFISIAGAINPIRPEDLAPGTFPIKGMAFFVFMCGRGIAWSIVSMGAGVGLGIALKSKQLALNGFVGGMLGGLIGGLFFDPISRFLVSDVGDGGISRGVGIAAVGAFVGLFIGFFENISKEAWMQMLKGPLAGKHFILFKTHMRIGSSPKSDIYLFKDPDVAPLHATIVRSGRRYMIQDEKSDKGVFVNGKQIDKYILQPSDTVTIGETVLRYNEKKQA